MVRIRQLSRTCDAILDPTTPFLRCLFSLCEAPSFLPPNLPQFRWLRDVSTCTSVSVTIMPLPQRHNSIMPNDRRVLSCERRLYISPLCTSDGARVRYRVTITATFAKTVIALGRWCAIARPPPSSRNYPESKQGERQIRCALSTNFLTSVVLAHTFCIGFALITYIRSLQFVVLFPWSVFSLSLFPSHPLPLSFPIPDARDARRVIVAKLEQIIALRYVRRYQCNAKRRKITARHLRESTIFREKFSRRRFFSHYARNILSKAFNGKFSQNPSNRSDGASVRV